MGGNLFTHAMSEAEVQAHEEWLKRDIVAFSTFHLSVFSFQFSPFPFHLN